MARRVIMPLGMLEQLRRVLREWLDVFTGVDAQETMAGVVAEIRVGGQLKIL